MGPEMGTDMGSVITRGLTHWLLNNRADINIEKSKISNHSIFFYVSIVFIGFIDHEHFHNKKHVLLCKYF